MSGTSLPMIAVISWLVTTTSLCSKCPIGTILLFLACHAQDSQNCCTAQFFPGSFEEHPLVTPHVYVWVLSGPKSDERSVEKGRPVQTDNNGCQPSKDGICLTQECKCFMLGAVARDTISVGVVLRSHL